MSKQLGQDYEQHAEAFLIKQGFQILARNFYCKGGELDLVGLDQGCLVFIEVKYRQTEKFGHPNEFVSAQKQQRLYRCAQNFLLKHPPYQSHPMRFDVIAFLKAQSNPDWTKDAFGSW